MLHAGYTRSKGERLINEGSDLEYLCIRTIAPHVKPLEGPGGVNLGSHSANFQRRCPQS